MAEQVDWTVKGRGALVVDMVVALDSPPPKFNAVNTL